MSADPALTLHWFSAWASDGTAPALAALPSRRAGTEVVAWHRPGAVPPGGVTARVFRADHDTWRALNEGVPVFDLRGATAEHAWIAELATSVPGIVVLAAPVWHALTLALPGGPATRLHLLHEEHGLAGLDGARDLRTGSRSGEELDAMLPLAGWLARRSLAVLADPDDPRCAVPAQLRVLVQALPAEPDEVALAVASLAARAGELRRRVAANLAADHVGAIVRGWVVAPAAGDVVFERGAEVLRALYGADA